MGILSRLFRKRPPPPEYEHELLGTLQMASDGLWESDQASVPFASDPIAVELHGTEEGPSDAALRALESFTENPESLRLALQEGYYELYRNYTSDAPGRVTCASVEDVWSTVNILGMRVQDGENYEMAVVFDWQHQDDGHVITSVVEAGRYSGESIDG